jgi:Dna[CI] antecedent DciA-like protein
MNARYQSEKSRANPVAVSGVVGRVIESLGLTRNYYGWLMVSKWPEIVGEHYDRKSRAFRFEDGVIFVAVEDASWRQMMALDSEKILNLIRSQPHGRVVKELRLVAGKKGN